MNMYRERNLVKAKKKVLALLEQAEIKLGHLTRESKR
jgi:hypothetical protein